jgi:hypothetical protein
MGGAKPLRFVRVRRDGLRLIALEHKLCRDLRHLNGELTGRAATLSRRGLDLCTCRLGLEPHYLSRR